MSSIHYFPRYSQKENMVTNYTMLLFTRLYNLIAPKIVRQLWALYVDVDGYLLRGVK